MASSAKVKELTNEKEARGELRVDGCMSRVIFGPRFRTLLYKSFFCWFGGIDDGFVE